MSKLGGRKSPLSPIYIKSYRYFAVGSGKVVVGKAVLELELLLVEVDDEVLVDVEVLLDVLVLVLDDVEVDVGLAVVVGVS